MNDEISTLDQLRLYVEWEENNNSELNGKKHVARWAVEEIERLQKAAQYAIGGLAMAYEAVSAKRYDEALLHCGHHKTALSKALLTRNTR